MSRQPRNMLELLREEDELEQWTQPDDGEDDAGDVAGDELHVTEGE